MTSRWTDRLVPRDAVSITIVALILAAFGLRVWGIWFGLPFLFHNDEDFEVIRALRLGSGEFDFLRISKGGYFYLLFVEYGVLFVVLLLSGVVSSANEFAEYYIKDPSAFYLVGRATTAVIGAITVYLVYKIGRLAYSTTTALIAAALLTVNVLHAYLSHFITVDVPMTCLATATLYFAVRIVIGGKTSDYWWAALLAALAATTKIPAALLLISLLIAHYYSAARARRGFADFLADKRLWQAVAIFIVAYVITTPGILMYSNDVFASWFGKVGLSIDAGGDGGSYELDDRALYANTNLYFYYFSILLESMTLPVFVLCIAGLGYAVWKHRPVDVMLMSFAIATYLVISMSTDVKQFFPRYILPAIPVLVLFGARLVDDVLLRLPERRKAIVSTVVVGLLAVWPAVEIAAANHRIVQEDTRAIARQWFDANVPEGSKVFIEGHRTTLTNSTVPLQNSAENLRSSIEYYRDREPGKAKYFQMALKVLSGKTYDLFGVQPADLEELQHYKDIGIQYFVLRPDAYPGSRTQFAWEDFVEDIRSDPDIELLQRFEPDPDSRPGPLIEIYRINSNALPRESSGAPDAVS
jgi:hypothetical protein